jgi:hypothetical protein
MRRESAQKRVLDVENIDVPSVFIAHCTRHDQLQIFLSPNSRKV